MQPAQTMETTLDQLRAQYRVSLKLRADQLAQALRRSPADLGAIHQIAHALQGSGATYGYPQVSELAAGVSLAVGSQILARAHELIQALASLANENPFMCQGEETPPSEEKPRARILLADDDVELARLVRHRLQRASYDVSMVYGGEEALAALERERFDLCLLDVRMPGLDGFTLLEEIRARPRFDDMRVVMLTALEREQDVVRAFELGADDYLNKPFRPRELVARLRRHVRARSQAKTDRIGKAALAGRFAEGELAEVVQMLGFNGKTGRLHIRGEHTRGALEFEGGRVIAASCGRRQGIQAAQLLLTVERGEFDFLPRRPGQEVQEEFSRGADALLMDVMRQQDEIVLPARCA